MLILSVRHFARRTFTHGLFIIKIVVVRRFIVRLLVTTLIAVFRSIGETVVAGPFTVKLSAVKLFSFRWLLTCFLLTDFSSSEIKVEFSSSNL